MKWNFRNNNKIGRKFIIVNKGIEGSMNEYKIVYKIEILRIKDKFIEIV